ncbi:MAG: hypothetical protein KGL63_14350, partial [Betaproteobacteria bacterium]|nr:hypothetical protein [Betaproteobacteria bacterium]
MKSLSTDVILFRALILCLPVVAFAADPASDWAWHADETLIGQEHGSFYSARPDGANSFLSHSERSYS